MARRPPVELVLALCGVSGLATCASPGDGGRDVVPPSSDVVVDASTPSRSTEEYEYVARRPGAVVALAEARGIAPGVAQEVVDHLADSLATCGAEHGSRQGAARLVAQIDDNGAVTAANVRVDPGAGVAESAVLCLAAPAKVLVFPPSDAGARGFAIEALWGLVPSGP